PLVFNELIMQRVRITMNPPTCCNGMPPLATRLCPTLYNEIPPHGPAAENSIIPPKAATGPDNDLTKRMRSPDKGRDRRMDGKWKYPRSSGPLEPALKGTGFSPYIRPLKSGGL